MLYYAILCGFWSVAVTGDYMGENSALWKRALDFPEAASVPDPAAN